jgi:hypothetical protein
MVIANTDGGAFVAPATKLEYPSHPKDGVPEGMRFALSVTDAEIEEWVAALPRQLPDATEDAARTIARALRDYGWFITDTGGGTHLQFEDRLTAGEAWDELGLGPHKADWKDFPRDLLDGLLSPERIYALVPSDEYPPRS